MYKGILSQEQIKLLPLVKKFSRDFGLVGGTAVSLQIGHRRSIDFDLFTFKVIDCRGKQGKNDILSLSIFHRISGTARGNYIHA